MNFPQIAMLTDFGEQDGYVGLMKGVIAQVFVKGVGNGWENLITAPTCRSRISSRRKRIS